MPRSDALAQISRLVTAFRQEDISDGAIEVYVDRLEMADPKVLRAAVDRILAGSRFFPSIAEILDECLRVSGLMPPSAAEVLALVRRADVRKAVHRRDGSFAYTERYWEFPEDAPDNAVALAEATLAKVGEPCDEDSKDFFGWEQGFKETYVPIAHEAKVVALANIQYARLAEVKSLALLAQPPGPGPEDEPIPMCDRCKKNMGFVPKDGRLLCFFCAKGL